MEDKKEVLNNVYCVFHVVLHVEHKYKYLRLSLSNFINIISRDGLTYFLIIKSLFISSDCKNVL